MQIIEQEQSQRNVLWHGIRRAVVYSRGTSRTTGEGFNYTLRFLHTSDVDELCRLQDAVLATLAKPFPIYERDAGFFAKCVTTRGCVVGALDRDRIVGYATLFLPTPYDTNYGSDLGLPSTQMSSVAHLAGSVTHPQYRGNGLQSRLVAMRDNFAAQTGYHHLCGEVVPNNAISMENHFHNGYVLKGFRFDKFGLPNYILHKNLSRRSMRIPHTDEHLAPVDNVAAYRSMMARGFWGYRIARLAGRDYLAYARFS